MPKSKPSDYLLMKKAIDECQCDLWALGRKLGRIHEWLDYKLKEGSNAKEKKESFKKTK